MEFFVLLPLIITLTSSISKTTTSHDPPAVAWEEIRFATGIFMNNDRTFLEVRNELLRSPKRCATGHLSYIFALLLLNACDCHPNPGPRTIKYPCGICQKAVRWSKTVRSVACSDCETWFHANCLGMCTGVYEPLERTDMSWYCCTCGLPNFNSSLFMEFEHSHNDSNSETNSNISLNSSSSSVNFDNPMSTSSPCRQRKTPISSNKARILSINFQSMKPKREVFWALLEHSEPDIILASETWLNPSIHEGEVLPANYTFAARKDRSTDPHGGVAIITRVDIDASEITLNTETEMVAASINTTVSKKPIIVCSLYRPTDNSMDYTNDMCDAIRDLHSRFKNNIFWMGGDANLPDINWATDSIEGNNYTKTINQTFIDTLKDIACQQVIDFPTRVNNILDIFATNRPTLIGKCSPIPGLSDHDVVLIDTNITPQRRKPVRRLIHLWSKANLAAIEAELTDFSADFVARHSHVTPVTDLWQEFHQKSMEVINTHVPSKYSTTRFNQPWCDRKIRRISRRKKRAHKQAKKTGKAEDWNRYKSIQKENQKTCRKAYHQYINDMVSEEGKSSKKLYTYVKSQKTEGSGVSSLKDGGILHSSPKAKAEILNQQFSSVFTREDGNTLPTIEDTDHPTIPDIKVSRNGVLKLLSGLNPHKASGPDSISTRFLKSMAQAVAPAITTIFQASISQGRIPPDWKLAFVTPIFKKGERSKAANYRPVSLTSVCCKCLEHIIHSHVITQLERNNILTDKQHGFRKRRSCESQLITTINDLASGLNDRQQIDAVLLDFSKAFDKVPHKRLSVKLHHYGVRGQTLSWIEDFLSGRTQQVVVDGEKSSPAPVSSGVPQGTVMGPLLFLVYINDLPDYVSSTTRLFADDCLMYRRICKGEDVTQLQEDINALQRWESDWGMSFNPEKCEVIRITNKRNIVDGAYSIHGHVLKVTGRAKYLGVTIDPKLSWSSHVTNVSRKANNTIAFLRRNISSCPKHIKHTCYRTLVRPQLEYASAVWDNSTKTQINALESVQRRAARFVMGDYNRSSSVTAMLEELQLDTLQTRRAQARATMMYRIINHLIDIPPTPLQPSYMRTRGHTARYLQPSCNIKAYQDSFFPATIRIWNSLPAYIVEAETLDTFKSRITTFRP